MSHDFRRSGATFFASVTPLLSGSFRRVPLSVPIAGSAILLKKKRASYANARLSSFEGTDKPRAPFMAQSGGAR